MGWLGERSIAVVIQPWLLPFNLSDSTVHGIAIAVSFFIITLLHVVVGEQAPKLVAIRNALSLVLWMSKPLHWFYYGRDQTGRQPRAIKAARRLAGEKCFFRLRRQR